MGEWVSVCVCDIFVFGPQGDGEGQAGTEHPRKLISFTLTGMFQDSLSLLRGNSLLERSTSPECCLLHQEMIEMQQKNTGSLSLPPFPSAILSLSL